MQKSGKRRWGNVSCPLRYSTIEEQFGIHGHRRRRTRNLGGLQQLCPNEKGEIRKAAPISYCSFKKIARM